MCHLVLLIKQLSIKQREQVDTYLPCGSWPLWCSLINDLRFRCFFFFFTFNLMNLKIIVSELKMM